MRLIKDLIKALSLECLTVQTVADTPRNSEIFGELEKLDEKFKSCKCEAEKIPILAKVYDLCLMMDVIG